jgi:hypothetical protein
MDRDAAVEAVVALIGVGTLAAIILWIGSAYAAGSLTGDGIVLTEQGSVALVGAIAFFILFMSAIGLGLSRRY